MHIQSTKNAVTSLPPRFEFMISVYLSRTAAAAIYLPAHLTAFVEEVLH